MHLLLDTTQNILQASYTISDQ